MATIKSDRDLEVWRRAVGLAVMVYRLTDGFPGSERYGLTSQMRRAAVSVASNLAEGFGRSAGEFSHYLERSRGSLAELDTQAEISPCVGFLNGAPLDALKQASDILGRQLNVLSPHVAARGRLRPAAK